MNTELDVARYIKLFPSQMHEGVRKYPTVVRGALKVNGVGVGFDAEERAEIIMAQVKPVWTNRLSWVRSLPGSGRHPNTSTLSTAGRRGTRLALSQAWPASPRP